MVVKYLTVDTDSETWVKWKRCGREAMLALQNHYDAKSEGELRKQVAKDDLNMSFYRNETILSLEKYVTKMKQKFNVI